MTPRNRVATHPGIIVNDLFLGGSPSEDVLRDVATNSGIDIDTLNKLLVGKHNVDLDIATKLANYFNTSKEMWISGQKLYDETSITPTDQYLVVGDGVSSLDQLEKHPIDKSVDSDVFIYNHSEVWIDTSVPDHRSTGKIVSIAQGTLVRVIDKYANMKKFVIIGREDEGVFQCYYNWAFVRNDPVNRERFDNYQKICKQINELRKLNSDVFHSMDFIGHVEREDPSEPSDG